MITTTTSAGTSVTRTRLDRHPGPLPVGLTRSQKPDCKPVGLWYEVNADWRSWCASEQPGWIEGRYLHSVTLGDERMLILRGSTDLDIFTETHALGDGGPLDGWGIDWPAVAREYDGIEIAPYVGSRRLEGRASRWYYSWDCASGCVWRPRGVRLELIEGPLSAPQRADEQREEAAP